MCNYGLKGHYILAQGNALGLEITPTNLALKGQHKKNGLSILPFQGVYCLGCLCSQGVALGYGTLHLRCDVKSTKRHIRNITNCYQIDKEQGH